MPLPEPRARSPASTPTRHTGLAFFQLESFTSPPALQRLDGTGGRADAVAGPARRAPAPAGEAPRSRVEQTSYPSHDGTEVGLFLVHRADASPVAATPAILTGYGGFAISSTPAWSPLAAAWCERGGLYAVAGLRGGVEEGEDWHHAGMLGRQAERVRRLRRRRRAPGRRPGRRPATAWPSGAARTAACWWPPR